MPFPFKNLKKKLKCFVLSSNLLNFIIFCLSMYVCIKVGIYACIYFYIYGGMYLCMCISMHVSIPPYEYMYLCMYLCMYLSTHTHLSMYTYMSVFIYVPLSASTYMCCSQPRKFSIGDFPASHLTNKILSPCSSQHPDLGKNQRTLDEIKQTFKICQIGLLGLKNRTKRKLFAFLDVLIC